MPPYSQGQGASNWGSEPSLKLLRGHVAAPPVPGGFPIAHIVAFLSPKCLPGHSGAGAQSQPQLLRAHCAEPQSQLLAPRVACTLPLTVLATTGRERGPGFFVFILAILLAL